MTNVSALVQDIPIEFLKLRKEDGSPEMALVWRFEYKGKTWGNFLYLKDEKEVRKAKMFLKKQANETFVHRAILIDVPTSDLIDELKDRLGERGYKRPHIKRLFEFLEEALKKEGIND